MSSSIAPFILELLEGHGMLKAIVCLGIAAYVLCQNNITFLSYDFKHFIVLLAQFSIVVIVSFDFLKTYWGQEKEEENEASQLAPWLGGGVIYILNQELIRMTRQEREEAGRL